MLKPILYSVFLTCFFAIGLSSQALGEASKKASAEPWMKRCGGDTENQKPEDCEIFQKLVVTKTGQTLVEFAIGYPQKDQPARGVILVPLGILVQSGIDIQIDEEKPFSAKIRTCTSDGCLVFTRLNDDILKMMRKGNKVFVRFKDGQGQFVNVELSLKGFTKALKQIQ